MLKKITLTLLAPFMLAGCIHKADIEQGNLINSQTAARLHTGMSQAEVKQIMGEPILMHTFSPNQLDYVYTLRQGHGQMREKYITLSFNHNRLIHIGGNMYSQFMR
jgi:outer membrane protein assembly factor BamE